MITISLMQISTLADTEGVRSRAGSGRCVSTQSMVTLHLFAVSIVSRV